LPRLEGIHSLSQTLATLAAEASLKLCLSPRARTPLGVRLRDWRLASPACVLIGPEGGFSDAELDLASAAGFESVALGPLILRTELAATVVLGCFVAFAPTPLDTL
jgi:16S rRNA (uracil1498-N3)-methyltransferase